MARDIELEEEETARTSGPEQPLLDEARARVADQRQVFGQMRRAIGKGFSAMISGFLRMLFFALYLLLIILPQLLMYSAAVAVLWPIAKVEEGICRILDRLATSMSRAIQSLESLVGKIMATIERINEDLKRISFEAAEGVPATSDRKGAEGGRPPFEVIWRRIVLSAGQTFRTKTGKRFTYRVEGDALHPSTTSSRVHKTDFRKAYPMVPIDGPGEISEVVRGSSYVWAVLHDTRISRAEWWPPRSQT